MAKLFSIKPAITLKGRKFKGIRGWAGKPTHPPLTDVPIAAYILAAAFDLVSFIVLKMKGADSTVASSGPNPLDTLKIETIVMCDARVG